MFSGLGHGSPLLVRSGEGWPIVDVSVTEEAFERPPTSLSADAATIPLHDGTCIWLDRTARTARFRHLQRPDVGDVVHPGLGFVGAVFGDWLGRECFHAGAFVADGGAWALLGATSVGKSSLLARLAARGHGVIADDFLVVEERLCFAGPRCVDLRDPAPAWLRLDGRLVPARLGARQRLLLPDVDECLPLRGWIFLGWGDRVEMERIAPADRLRRLAEQRLSSQLGTPAGLLDLAALPAWDFRRPHTWESLEPAIERLLDALGS